jgi:hypothetical protein
MQALTHSLWCCFASIYPFFMVFLCKHLPVLYGVSLQAFTHSLWCYFASISPFFFTCRVIQTFTCSLWCSLQVFFTCNDVSFVSLKVCIYFYGASVELFTFFF